MQTPKPFFHYDHKAYTQLGRDRTCARCLQPLGVNVMGFGPAIVTGGTTYYPRFDFKPASNWKISAPFDVPDEAFMALELSENALKNSRGVVRYPEEFNVVQH